MNVPTVRPRLAPGLDEEDAGKYYAENPIKPDVPTARDTPWRGARGIALAICS